LRCRSLDPNPTREMKIKALVVADERREYPLPKKSTVSLQTRELVLIDLDDEPLQGPFRLRIRPDDRVACEVGGGLDGMEVRAVCTRFHPRESGNELVLSGYLLSAEPATDLDPA